MSSCNCDPAVLTEVSFDNGIVLLRCPAHESQRWLLDGEPVGADVALVRLRELFVQQRSGRSGRPQHPHPHPRRGQVIRLPEPVRAADPFPTADEPSVDDASLTALLQARGLSGTWAIA